jgi:hypothetical protein
MTNTWQNGHLILFPSLLIIVLLNFLLIVLLDLLKKKRMKLPHDPMNVTTMKRKPLRKASLGGILLQD